MLQKLHITFLLKYVLHMEECKKKKKHSHKKIHIYTSD